MQAQVPGPDRTQAQAGEAAFSQAVHALTAQELSEPSLLPGWSRATLISHVAANARAFVRAIEAAVEGSEDTRMYSSREQRDAQIAEGAKQDPSALVADSDDAAATLERTWNSLSEDQFSLEFTNGQGRQAPLVGTVKGRTREIWVHLVDLGSTATFAQVPAEITESVLREVWESWTARGASEDLAITTTATDGASLTLGAAEEDGTTLVSGSLADVTGWATGRLRTGATASLRGESAPLPTAPDWI